MAYFDQNTKIWPNQIPTILGQNDLKWPMFPKLTILVKNESI